MSDSNEAVSGPVYFAQARVKCRTLDLRSSLAPIVLAVKLREISKKFEIRNSLVVGLGVDDLGFLLPFLPSTEPET